MLFAMPRAVALVAATVLAVAFAGLPATAQVKTIEQGKLHIAMNGDMPMTQLKDGVLSGTDGELMVYRHGGFFYAMDTYREYEALNTMWAGGEAPWKVWE